MLLNSHKTSTKSRNCSIRFRSCTEPQNITGVICEKQSKPSIIECEKIHLICKDGTCLLSISEYDLEDDCSDASDEDNCLDKNSSDRHTIIILSYFQSDLLEIETYVEIPVHILCDGIYSNGIPSQEEKA